MNKRMHKMENKNIKEIIFAILGDVAKPVSEKEFMNLMGFRANEHGTDSLPPNINFFVLDDKKESNIFKKGRR
jgi:hypothetical protein